jgi:ubiquinone/menaquinone biosynthesis C-methylase UbiE
VTAFDITYPPLMREKLEETDANFVQGALPNLLFKDGVFDLIIYSEGLEHLPDRDEQYNAIQSNARSLSKGVYLVLITPNPKSIFNCLNDAAYFNLNTLNIDGQKEGQLIENWAPRRTVKKRLNEFLDIEAICGIYNCIPDLGRPRKII